MSAFQDLDNNIFLSIAQDIRNDFFDILMPAASNYLLWIPAAVALIGYCYWKDKPKTVLLLISAAIALALSELLVSQLLKELVMRVRPCSAFPDIEFLGSCTGSYSFPSAHASNSFMIFAVVSYFFHRFWHYALACALLVAFSRVYLGVHYFSDVVAGAVIGMFIGYGIAATIDVAYIKQKDKRKKTVW